jgi:hypothetical protein
MRKYICPACGQAVVFEQINQGLIQCPECLAPYLSGILPDLTSVDDDMWGRFGQPEEKPSGQEEKDQWENWDDEDPSDESDWQDWDERNPDDGSREE